jgi:hypothetical protein
VRAAPLLVGLTTAASLAFGLPAVMDVTTNDALAASSDSYKVGSSFVDQTAIGTLTREVPTSRALRMEAVLELEVGPMTDLQFQRREGMHTVDGVETDRVMDLAVLGLSDIGGGFQGFEILDITDPTQPVSLSRRACGDFHNDIAVWENYLVLGSDGFDNGACDGDVSQTGPGIYVFDITDPARPALVAGFDGASALDRLELTTGTHNLAIHPDGLVYYATAGFDAVEPDFGYVDLTNLEGGQVDIPMRDISPTATDGCHDMGFSFDAPIMDPITAAITPTDLMVCPAIETTYIWDITNPKMPVQLSAIANPAINIHHGGRFAPDGTTLLLGDELAGAGAPSGCFSGGPVGAIWTYDLTSVRVPVLTGYVSASESPGTIETCTSHFYNFVPNSDDKTLVMTGWYGSGMVMHDVTNLASASVNGLGLRPIGAGAEVAHLEPTNAELWSAYAYRGYVYGGSYTGNTGLFIATLDGYTDTSDAELEPYAVDEGTVWGRWTPRS